MNSSEKPKENNIDDIKYVKIDKVNKYFLTAKNNFEIAVPIKSDPCLVELKNNKTISGITINEFNLNGERYLAVKPSDHRDIHYNSNLWAPILIEIELFGEHFKGFIVNFNDVTVKPKEVHCVPNSKVIDRTKIVSMEYITTGEINNPNVTDPNNPDNIKKIIYLRDKIPLAYVRIRKRVLINCVDCVLVEYIQPPVENNKEFYLKNTDLINISNFKLCTVYYNSVIIEPSSILIMETNANMSYKIDNLVRFEDSDDQNYHGRIVWTGKVNRVKAALIALNENLSIDNIRPYIANKVFESYMGSSFSQLTVCVPHFALKDDLITYLTCSKTNLELVDPKIQYQIETISTKEKLITFTFKEELHVATLKWTGSIYKKMCIGCQLNYESDVGSNGTYGSQELFKCHPKTGAIITADKINSDRITGLCEFGNHKNIEWRLTKYGYKVYDESSICCLENLDQLEGMAGLRIGYKILYDRNFIGICKFIGKINGQPTVGVETEPNYCEGNASFSDLLNSYAFKNQKCNFMNAKDISVGSFYTNYEQNDKFKDIANSIGESVYYFPDNNRTNDPIRGKLILLKRHGKNNVCGIDLENENNDFSTNYFLEKDLFGSSSRCPVIDDIYKIECIETCNSAIMEETSLTIHCQKNINENKQLRSTIKSLLDKSNEKMPKIAKNTIPIYPKEFAQYLHKNESMVPLKDISIICELLYHHGEVETIKVFIKNTQTINDIWPSLSTLFSLCIKENKLDIVVEALDGLEISEDNDEANSICLQLAVKALENISKSDPPEYDVLYQPLMEKCTNKAVYLTNSNEDIRETFITRIIMDKSISESVVIKVLNSKQFDIDQQNSSQKSPLQIAVEGFKCNIVATLLGLGCNKESMGNCMEFLIYRKVTDSSQSNQCEPMLQILNNEVSRCNRPCGMAATNEIN